MDEPYEQSLAHEHHYTVEQANAARPWVRERVGRIQGALEELRLPASRELFDELDPADGGGYPGRPIARAVLDILWAASELQAVDVVLRDADKGLVDFPSIRDGEEIYLCWLAEEPRVGWWHEPEAGFAGRQPL
jgi:hypothetical protein